MKEGKRNYPANRKSRAGYVSRHPNGELTKVPWGGARNTKSVQVRVKHGGTAHLEHARLDKRTWAGRVYMSICKDLTAHVGGDPSAAQQLLIDSAARLKLSLDIAWGCAMKDGLAAESPSFDHFIKCVRNLRETLNILGVKRTAKPISLGDYITGRAGELVWPVT